MKVSDFQNLRANATRVRIDDAVQGGANPVRTGPTAWSLGGRMVARLKEWFGTGQAQNRQAGQALIHAVQQEYGTDAADAVREQLQNRALKGKPLSARRVNISLDVARQNAFSAIKNVPAWQAHLKASLPHESLETVLRQFLNLHAQAQPPVLDTAQMKSLLGTEHGRLAVLSHLADQVSASNGQLESQAMDTVMQISDRMDFEKDPQVVDAMEQQQYDVLAQLPARKVLEHYPAAGTRELVDMQNIVHRKQEEQLAQSRYGITPQQFFASMKAGLPTLPRPAEAVFTGSYLSSSKGPREETLRANLLKEFRLAETLDNLYDRTVKQCNRFQVESFVSGGGAFNDMRDTVASELLGVGVDATQIPLTGLGGAIQKEVDRLAQGPDGKPQLVTKEQVKDIAKGVMRSRCEHFKSVAEQLKAANLDGLSQTMAGEIFSAEPDISADRLLLLTSSARQQYKSLKALSEGDETAAMQAFAQANASIAVADPLKGLVRDVAIQNLSTEQQIKAYQGMQTSPVVGEILSFNSDTIMSVLSPYDDDATHEYQSAGLLFSMSNELRSWREGLNVRLGLSEEMGDLRQDLKARTMVLSDATQNAVNAYRQVALETAIQQQQSTVMFERAPLYDLTHALPPKDALTENHFGGVFRSMAKKMTHAMKLPDSQNLFMPNAAGLAGSVSPQGLSQSGRNRLDQLQFEADVLLAKHQQATPVGRDWAQAQNDPRMRQFKLDAINRPVGIQLSPGEQLSSTAAGEQRWERWNTELQRLFVNPVEVDNARTELTQLLTQATFADLGTSFDNLEAHGWMPLGFDSQDAKMHILDKDADGYLQVAFSFETTLPGLVMGNSQKPIQKPRQDGEQIDYQMHALMRYKPSDLPGAKGDVRFDQHMTRYQVRTGLAD